MTATEGLKPGTSTGYAFERVEWLKSYLGLAEEFAAEVRMTTYEAEYSNKAKTLRDKLDLDRREAQRVLGEVDFEREFNKSTDYREARLVLRKAIREWERLRDEVDSRVTRLRAFLSLAREVADLEKMDVRDQALRNASPSDPIIRAGTAGFIEGRAGDIRAGRDALTTEQPEIEMILRDVGNSFDRWSFAAGVHSGVDFIADQVLQAVGKYLRLTRPPRPLGASASAVANASPKSGTAIVDAITRALRPAFKEPPTNERDVQDQIEQILRVLGVDYHRDKEVAAVGPTSFRPDFTIASQDLAIEVKFANDRHSAAAVQRELAEDVAGYRTKWKHLLAVVYDLGAIRDPEQMRRQNEAHFGVCIVIVKH